MDIKEAERIVRSIDDVNSVWFSFRYGDRIGFAVSPNKEYIFGDPTATAILINSNGDIEQLRMPPFDLDESTIQYLDMKSN